MSASACPRRRRARHGLRLAGFFAAAGFAAPAALEALEAFDALDAPGARSAAEPLVRGAAARRAAGFFAAE
ncbi:hypothetical protein, partial [Burkholderia thailandensis]|uniref:hypothetical protein n=1 Tax=Burkholderia thailandensis TaxID=57975 RepID=UPI001ED8D810